MSQETYLNHPTFGLLYRVCLLEEQKDLFATLYAQRLFFLVIGTTQGVLFEPISRSDAKLLMEHRMRGARRAGSASEYDKLQVVYKQTFQ